MKLKKGSAAAKAYMAKIRAKRKTVKKIGAIAKGSIITFSDGFQFKKVSKDYAAKNYTKKEIFGIDLENETESLIQDKSDLNSYDIFGTSLGFKKSVGSKVGYKSDRTKMLKTATAYMKKYKDKGYSRSEAIRQANIDASFVGSKLQISAKERRLGATPKDVKGNGYHKDTKSHNVNIRVVSGVNKIGAIDLNVVGNELLKLEREISELSSFIKAEKNASERRRLREIKAIKQNQFKTLKGYLNSIARFTFKR